MVDHAKNGSGFTVSRLLNGLRRGLQSSEVGDAGGREVSSL